MIPLVNQYKLYLYTGATDMRKAFDGLSGIISSALDRDPLDGSVYIFINRRRNRMKCLVWDGDGFWLFYKRLEKGTFQIPLDANGQHAIALSYEQWMLILEGIDLDSVRRRPRYSHPHLALK